MGSEWNRLVERRARTRLAFFLLMAVVYSGFILTLAFWSDALSAPLWAGATMTRGLVVAVLIEISEYAGYAGLIAAGLEPRTTPPDPPTPGTVSHPAATVVDTAEADRLRADYWARYGTTLAGLMAEHGLEPGPYLAEVHDIDFSGLAPDPLLAARIVALPGRKIVFTNGCFDLLHPGHVETLEFVRRRCSVMIVACNSDDSVARLKGPARPLVPQKFRMRLLEPFADAIFLLEQDNVRHLLELLKVDIYVKGAEYEDKALVEADIVAKYGGEVLYAPMVPGFSTTSLSSR